jgi:hypothetical protein
MKGMLASAIVLMLLYATLLNPVVSAGDSNYRIDFGPGSTENWRYENASGDSNHSFGAFGDVNDDGYIDILDVGNDYGNFTAISGSDGHILWERLNLENVSNSIPLENASGASGLDILLCYTPGTDNKTVFELVKCRDGNDLWITTVNLSYDEYSLFSSTGMNQNIDVNNDDKSDVPVYSYCSNNTTCAYDLVVLDGTNGKILWRNETTVGIGGDQYGYNATVTVYASEQGWDRRYAFNRQQWYNNGRYRI